MNRGKIKINIDSLILLLIYLYAAFVFMFNADSTKNHYIYLAATSLMAFLFLGIIKHTRVIKVCNEMIILAIYLAFGLTSSIWAVDSDMTFVMVRTVLILLALTILLYNWNAKRLTPEVFIKAIIIGGTSEAVYFISLYGWNNVWDAINEGYRIGQLLNNENAIGNSIAITMVAIIGYGLCYKKTKSLFCLIPNIIVLLATDSRTAFVSFLLGSSIVIFLYINHMTSSNNLQKISKMLMFIVVVIVAWNFLSDLPMFSGITKRFEDMYKEITGQETKATSVETRMIYVSLGWRQFLTTPVLGNGFGCAGYVIKEKFGYITYLHNNFIEILASGGTVGFLLFYGVYAFLMAKIIKKLKEKNPVVIISFALLCSELFSHMGCVNYYSKITYLLFALWFSVANNMYKKVNKSEEEKNFNCSM